MTTLVLFLERRKNRFGMETEKGDRDQGKRYFGIKKSDRHQ